MTTEKEGQAELEQLSTEQFYAVFFFFFYITDFPITFTHSTRFVCQENVKKKIKITLKAKKSTVNILKYHLSVFFCAYI